MALEPTTSSTPEIFTYPTKRGIPLIPHHPGRRNRPRQPPQDPVTTQSMILTSIASTTEGNINSTTETEDGTTPELTPEETSDGSDTSDAEDTDDTGDVSDTSDDQNHDTSDDQNSDMENGLPSEMPGVDDYSDSDYYDWLPGNENRR